MGGAAADLGAVAGNVGGVAALGRPRPGPASCRSGSRLARRCRPAGFPWWHRRPLRMPRARRRAFRPASCAWLPACVVIARCSLRRRRSYASAVLAFAASLSLYTPNGKVLTIQLSMAAIAFGRREPPVGRAGRKHLDQAEPLALELPPEGRDDRLLRLPHGGRLVDRHAGDVARAVQRGEHFADLDRRAFELARCGRRAWWSVFWPKIVVGAICPPVMP